MGKLNHNRMGGNHNANHVRQAHGLKLVNTQDFHDEYLEVSNESNQGVTGTKIIVDQYQQLLNQLWDINDVPSWLSQPLYQYSDEQINALIQQAKLRKKSVQNTLTTILIRDKNQALLTAMMGYQVLIKVNPVEAVDRHANLRQLIDAHNDQRNIIVDKGYRSASGYTRLRQISRLSFDYAKRLGLGNGKSKRLVSVDIGDEAQRVVRQGLIRGGSRKENQQDNHLEK